MTTVQLFLNLRQPYTQVQPNQPSDLLQVQAGTRDGTLFE
jgi:hypothetical protein